MNEELVEIIKPPENPFEAVKSHEWLRIENAIGTILPNDYKWFIEHYGSGTIGSFLYILNPISNNKYYNLIKYGKLLLNGLRHLREQTTDNLKNKEFPYPIFPEKGGLLLFGTTLNGDSLFWLTKGLPDKWSIVIHQVRSDNYEEFPMQLTDFLYQLIEENIETFFDETDFDVDIGFVKHDS